MPKYHLGHSADFRTVLKVIIGAETRISVGPASLYSYLVIRPKLEHCSLIVNSKVKKVKVYAQQELYLK